MPYVVAEVVEVGKVFPLCKLPVAVDMLLLAVAEEEENPEDPGRMGFELAFDMQARKVPWVVV